MFVFFFCFSCFAFLMVSVVLHIFVNFIYVSFVTWVPHHICMYLCGFLFIWGQSVTRNRRNHIHTPLSNRKSLVRCLVSIAKTLEPIAQWNELFRLHSPAWLLSRRCHYWLWLGQRSDHTPVAAYPILWLTAPSCRRTAKRIVFIALPIK